MGANYGQGGGIVKRKILITALAFTACAAWSSQTLAVEVGTEQQTTAMDQSANRASRLIGKSVQNRLGEHLGAVEDLIVMTNGQVNYLILAPTNIAGMSGDLVPIPWDAAEVQFQGDTLVVNLDSGKIRSAPSFQSSAWPDFTQPGYNDQVFGYYGEQPPTGMEQQQQQKGDQSREWTGQSPRKAWDQGPGQQEHPYFPQEQKQ